MAPTPGPWRVHHHQHLSIGHFTHEGTSNPDGRWIGPVAELKYLIANDAEQLANAHLIAAAPDMFASLKEMRDALAAAMRVIEAATPDKADIIDCFLDELKAAGVLNGVGVRATAAIANAEGRG